MQCVWLRIVGVLLLSVGLNILSYFVTFPNISSVAHNLIGLAMGLLLVFRTNTAYDRFWEGRKSWSTIVHSTRSLSRILMSTDVPKTTALGENYLNVLVSYSVSLKHWLRGNEWDEERQDLAQYMGSDTLDMLERVTNRPQAILTLFGSHIQDIFTQGIIEPPARVFFEQLCSDLATAQSNCERIINTPLPLPYLIQIRQVLFIYLVTVPIPFQFAYPNWLSLVACLLLAFGLFGIEEAGKVIENPFGDDPSDLPLQKYCKTIEKDIHDMNQMLQQLMVRSRLKHTRTFCWTLYLPFHPYVCKRPCMMQSDVA